MLAECYIFSYVAPELGAFLKKKRNFYFYDVDDDLMIIIKCCRDIPSMHLHSLPVLYSTLSIYRHFLHQINKPETTELLLKMYNTTSDVNQVLTERDNSTTLSTIKCILSTRTQH